VAKTYLAADEYKIKGPLFFKALFLGMRAEVKYH